MWTSTEINTNLRYLLQKQGNVLKLRGGSDNRGSTYLFSFHDAIQSSLLRLINKHDFQYPPSVKLHKEPFWYNLKGFSTKDKTKSSTKKKKIESKVKKNLKRKNKMDSDDECEDDEDDSEPPKKSVKKLKGRTRKKKRKSKNSGKNKNKAKTKDKEADRDITDEKDNNKEKEKHSHVHEPIKRRSTVKLQGDLECSNPIYHWQRHKTQEKILLFLTFGGKVIGLEGTVQADNHNRVARFDIEVKIEKDKNEDDLDDVLGDVDPQIKVQQNRNKNDSNISSNNSNSNNNNADVTCLPRTFEVEYEHEP